VCLHGAGARARRPHEVPGIDRAVGANILQVRRLADAGDTRALDQDRAVLDDAALGVEGEDVAGVLDLQRRGAHGAAGSLRGGRLTIGQRLKDGIRTGPAQAARAPPTREDHPAGRPGRVRRGPPAGYYILASLEFRPAEDPTRWISGSLPSRRRFGPRCEPGSRPTCRRTGRGGRWWPRTRSPSSTSLAAAGSASFTRPGSSASRGRRSTGAA